MGALVGWIVIGVFIAVSHALVMVFGGIALLMSTIYLKVILAIGPLFILALIWPVTARLFDSWFAFVMNHTLIVALTTIVLALGVIVYDHQISKVMLDSDHNMLAVALELLVVAAILYAVTKGVDTAGKAADVAKGTGASGKGLFKMGKWGYDKLRGGNSVSNAGASSN